MIIALALSCKGAPGKWDSSVNADGQQDGYGWQTILTFEVIQLNKASGYIDLEFGYWSDTLRVPLYAGDSAYDRHQRIARCSFETDEGVVGWAKATKDYVSIGFNSRWFSIDLTNDADYALNVIDY